MFYERPTLLNLGIRTYVASRRNAVVEMGKRLERDSRTRQAAAKCTLVLRNRGDRCLLSKQRCTIVGLRRVWTS